MYENRVNNRFKFNLPKRKKERNITIYNSYDYIENSKTNNLIPKLMIVCLFFFIFVFCASRFGTAIAKEYSEEDFNTNLTYIKNEALTYYKKENTASQVGTISQLSLNELINKGIINKNKISNIDNCDLDNSYIKLTGNSNSTYTILVSINCNGILEEKEDIVEKL